MALIRPCNTRKCQFNVDGGLHMGRITDMALIPSNAAPKYCKNNYNTVYGAQHGALNHEVYHNYQLCQAYIDRVQNNFAPSLKRRKVSSSSCKIGGRRAFQDQYSYQFDVSDHARQYEPNDYFNADSSTSSVHDISTAATEIRCNNSTSGAPSTMKRDRSKFEDDGMIFMSRDEIELSSPSRRDGISPMHETYLRHTYCAFLQHLGFRLDLPQTTIASAMVLCHRFFFRRSHASHDRHLISTAALFLASKSEETHRSLNDVLRVSAEIMYKLEFSALSYMLPLGWFEQYREQIIGAEQLILTTLNFELTVEHPYESVSCTLQKLGFSSVLVNLALYLVSEGLRSLLWLQFKPQQIGAGAAYLASKLLSMNLASAHTVWHEFHTPPSVLKDIAHQLMEVQEGLLS